MKCVKHWRHRPRIAAVAAMIVASVTPASGAADDTPLLSRLAEAMAGRFDTQCQCANGSASPGERFVDWRQRIDAPALGDYVFYQQLNRGDKLTLYRQRILVLRQRPDSDRVEQVTYALREAERYVDGGASDAVFDDLGTDRLEPVFDDGCEQVWTATGSGFIGYVNPETCRIVSKRTGKPRRIEARTTIGLDGLSLVERGYDDDGNQLFGTPPGESLSLWRVDDGGRMP